MSPPQRVQSLRQTMAAQRRTVWDPQRCAVADELELQSCVLQLMRLTGIRYEAVAAGLRQAVSVSPYDFRIVTDQLVRGIIRMRPSQPSTHPKLDFHDRINVDQYINHH